MTTIRMLVLAVSLLMATVLVGSSNAQDSSEQGQLGGSGEGYMMSSWMTNSQGMGIYGNMGPGMMGWNGRGTSTCAAMGSHIDGRLAYLKAKLKITDAQEHLWTTYAGAMRDSAKSMVVHCTAMMGPRQAAALSLADRLDQHQQFMAAQLDALGAMNEAPKPLYAVLSDTQKQAAEQLLWGLMGMR